MGRRVLTGLLLVAVLVMMGTAALGAEAPSAWAEEGVKIARENSLVPDAVDSAYTQSITRAEFCTLAAALYRQWDKMDIIGEVQTETVSFADCGDADVLLCASVGIVKGVGDGRFEPDAPIERQAAASMLHRLGALRRDFAEQLEDRLPHVFADGADLRAWAREDVYWAYWRGVMTGVGDNRLVGTRGNSRL